MKPKKLTEADVTAESVFMLQRRQVSWTGLKVTTARRPRQVKP